MKFNFTVLLLVLIFNQLSSAQIAREPQVLPSPNVASLGEYLQAGAPTFAGNPNIAVPIKAINDGDLTMNVRLNYNSSGFKPEAHPGWVGSGWNMNVGGVITRKINDLADEFDINTSADPLASQAGYYFNHSVLNRLDWDQPSFTGPLLKSANAPCAKDTEPDEYSFSFDGYNGKFYLNHLGVWQVKCDKPLKVVLNYTDATNSTAGQFIDMPFSPPPLSRISRIGYSKSFAGFTIITDTGVKYVFGASVNAPNTNAIEYSVGMFTQSSEQPFAVSWHLTQVITPSDRTATFVYEPGSFTTQMYISIYQVSIANPSCSGGGSSNIIPNATIDKFYSGKLIRPVYLKTVTTPHCKIEFARSFTDELDYVAASAYKYELVKPGRAMGYPLYPLIESDPSLDTYPQCLSALKWEKLDDITFSFNNEIATTFHFNYLNNSQHRLQLLSVVQKDADGVDNKTYAFEYNDYFYNGTVSQEPPYLCNMTDHWGYFNNSLAANLQNFGNYYSFKEPNTTTPIIYLSGTLKKITYPAKGYTSFQYEPHTYSKHVNEGRWGIDYEISPSVKAGGLRIQSIANYDDAGVMGTQRSYIYVSGYTLSGTNTTSSGTLNGVSRYYYPNYNLVDVNGGIATESIFASQSFLPTSRFAAGNHVGYSEVVEKQLDNSYTIHYFTNFENGYKDDLTDPYIIFQATRTSYEDFTSREDERGLLLGSEAYNSQGILVKSNTTSYSIEGGNQATYVRSLKAFFESGCNADQVTTGLQSGVPFPQILPYGFYTYSLLPSIENETVYDKDGTNPITTSRNLTYNSYKLVASETKGGQFTTSYLYPCDLVYNGPNPAHSETLTLLALKANNMISYPIETVTKRNGLITKVNVVRYGTYNSKFLLPSAVYTTELERPLSSNLYTPIHFSPVNGNIRIQPLALDPLLKLQQSLTNYDEHANIVGATTKGAQQSSFIWDYGQTLPIAKVSNAAPAATAFTSFEADAPSFVNNTYISAGLFSWDYDPRLGQTTHLQRGGVSGHNYYLLDGGWGVSRSNVPTGDYELTLWAKSSNGNPISYLHVFADQIIHQNDDFTNSQGYHLLHYRVHILQANGINIDAYGQQVSVDDVRLYPVGAQMTTNTYEPMIGVSSSSDANSLPTYYEYDKMQRLKIVRNTSNNITQHYQYNFKP